MADLTLRISGDVDAKELVGLSGTAEELTKSLKALEAAADDASGKRVSINIETTTKGSGRIREVLEATEELDKGTLKLQKAIKKATNAEKGSVASSRALVSNLTQQKNATETGSIAWRDLNKRLSEASREYNKSRGIQEGSVTSLQQQVTALKDAARNTKLTETSAKSYADAINTLNGKIRDQKGIQAGSKADLQAIRQELIAARDATDRFTDPQGFANLARQIEAVDDRLDAFVTTGQRLNRIIDTVGRLRVVFDTVQQVVQSFNAAIGVFVQRTKQIESFNLALRNVGLSFTEVNDAFEQASNTAKSLGAPLQSVERSYKRMIPSLVAIGVSAEDSDRFIEALTARTQTLGLNTEQSGRLLEAFAQVLSKGKLQSEELNQQISELDGAFRNQFAKSIGVTTSELEDLIAAGAITSTRFVKGVQNMENGVDALRLRVTTGNETIQQLQNNINNIRTENIQTLSKAFDPMFRAVLQAQLAVEKLVASLADAGVFEDFANLVTALVQGLTAFINVLGAVTNAVVRVFSQITGLFAAIDGGTGIFTFAAQAVGFLLTALIGLLIVKGLKAGIVLLTSEIVKLAVQAKGAAGGVNLFNGSLLALKGTKITGDVASVASNTAAAGTAAGNATGFFAGLGAKFKAILPALKPLLVGFAKFAVVALLAAAPIKILVDRFTNLRDGGKAAGDGFAIAEQGIKDLGASLDNFETDKAQNALVGLIKRADEYLGLSKMFSENAENNRFIGFVEAIEKSDKSIQKLRVNLAATNQVLTKNSDLNKLNNGQILSSIDAQKTALSATQANIEAIEAEIEAKKKDKNARQEQIQALQDLLEGQKLSRDQIEATITALENEGISRGIVSKRIQEQSENLKKLVAAQKDLEISVPTFVQNAEATSYERLTDGIYSVAEAEAFRQSATAIGDQALLANLVAQRDEYFRIAGEQGRLTDVQKKGLEEVTKKIAEQRNTAAQSFLGVKNSIVDAFESGINEANEFADIAFAAAGRVQAAFDGIGSAALSGVQAGLAVVSQISQNLRASVDRDSATRLKDAKKESEFRIATAEKQAQLGLISEFKLASIKRSAAAEEAKIQEEADSKKRAILAQEIRVKQQMIQIEHEIESLRIDVSTRVRIAEAKAMKARLKGEAAIARAKGNSEAARQLESAAGFQDAVIEGAKIEGELQKKILGFRTKQKQAALAGQAAANNIGGVDSPDLGGAIEDLSAFAREAKDALRSFADMVEKASNIGENLNDSNLEEGKKKADDVRDAIFEAARGASSFAAGIESVETAFSDASSQASKLLGIVRSINNVTGVNRRAMGGPVEAGSQYLVNDGGGREAFLNSFGRMSMLPAGRNIKWTAPSSGTVIPAHLVEDFRSRLMARESINNTRSVQQPSQPVSRNIIRTSTTKSLATSSSSQRIVNHVTIQSQSPLLDASRLMTNVTKIKSRRRL